MEYAIHEVCPIKLHENETNRLVETFAFHELGYIPGEYVSALKKLHQRFLLAAVIDIWSPKKTWLDTFERSGITSLFSAMSFSSDHGMVKPSPNPFQKVLSKLCISNKEAIVIGDSARRDLGGARDAGIDCILVGGEEHPHALKTYSNLLEFCSVIQII